MAMEKIQGLKLFERELTLAFLREVGTDQVIQDNLACVVSRDFTSNGFFVYLDKEMDSLNLQGTVSNFKGGQTVRARVNNSIELGVVFYVEDGRLDCIEVYTYGEDFPKDIDSFDVRTE